MKIGEKVKLLDEEGSVIIKELRSKSIMGEDEFGFIRELQYSELIIAEEIPKQNITVPKNIASINNSKKPIINTILEELVVDLHIGHLVDYPNQYTAHEKFRLQIREAQNAIKNSRQKAKKLILIHGKGKGKLENEILEILKKTRRIKYKDADFTRYKLGAVEIRYI